MHRRAFLTATAAAASAVTLKAAYAATVSPLGATGVPGRSTEPLPLGPLSGSVYPDPTKEEEEFEVRGLDRKTSGPGRIQISTAEIREFLEPLSVAIELTALVLPSETITLYEPASAWLTPLRLRVVDCAPLATCPTPS